MASYTYVVRVEHDPLALEEFSWWANVYLDFVVRERFLGSTTSHATALEAWCEAGEVAVGKLGAMNDQVEPA